MPQNSAVHDERTPALVAAHKKLVLQCGKVAEQARDGRIMARFSSKLRYVHDGEVREVSPFDLMSFGEEIERRKLGGYIRNSDNVVIQLNAAGQRLFKSIGAPAPARAARPAGQAISVVADRAERFVKRMRVAAINDVFRQLGLPEEHVPGLESAPTIHAENAEQLLVPVLNSVMAMKNTIPAVVVDVAAKLGIDRTAVKQPFGVSGRSLEEHVKHCVDYLSSKGYLNEKSVSGVRNLNGNMKGASMINSRALAWPAFTEIAPAVAVEVPKKRGVVVDVEKMRANLSAAGMNNLKVSYINATVLMRSDDPEVRAKAEQGLSMIVEEMARRSSEPRAARERPAVDVADGFSWPSTALAGERSRRGGSDFFDDLGDGMLKFFGYKAGNYGLSGDDRQEILDSIFYQELPPIFHPDEMTSWGEPESPERLRRLARSLAFLARSQKLRQGVDNEEAISNWEDDLDYLYDNYYVDRFDFAWPRSDDDMNYGRSPR